MITMPEKLMITPNIVSKFTFSSFNAANIIIMRVGHILKIIFISIDFSDEFARVIEKAKHNSKTTKSKLDRIRNFFETFLKSGRPYVRNKIIALIVYT